MPWIVVSLISVGWFAAWLLADAVAIWLAVRSARYKVLTAGARVAAIGGGVTMRGAIVTVGPPIALILLRLAAAVVGF